MKTVEVTCENGASWRTNVSGKSTPESKDAYFIGQMFNTSSYPNEVMSKCISAEYVDQLYIVQGRASGIGWCDCSKPLDALDAERRQVELFETGMMSGTTGKMSDWTRIVPVEEANCKY